MSFIFQLPSKISERFFSGKSFLTNCFIMLIIAGLCFSGNKAIAQVSITTGTYAQDFNTLASSGTSTFVPTGWMFNESGTNANSTYTAGNGSSNSGDTYSFGASGSTDRAFGGLLSGSLTPLVGAWFQNNTGQAINSITISFTGEQWRLGTADANNDVLDFEYQVGVNAITAPGTWISVNELDFTSPSSSTAGAKNGNLAENRTNLSYTITGLNVANGQSFTIRWSDFNVSSSDDGLAIDDFSLAFTNASTNVGINETFAILNFGAADMYYDLKANTGNPDFDNADLGVFNSSQSLYLDGAQNKVYKCGEADITGGSLFYRIYPVAGVAPSFSTAGIGFLSGVNNGCGGQDQTWETSNAGINLLNGRCDGTYYVEVYTTASSNSGSILADNNGTYFKAKFTINNSAHSGIYESFIVLNKNSTGNIYYDLNAATGNPDFATSLGNFCSNETLVLAGGENKIFKCGLNNVINGTLYYRIYPAATPGGTYMAVNLGTANNIGGAEAGCQNQQWFNTTHTTNILSGLTPGNYTIEVYSQADYNLGAGAACGTMYANNAGNNYKANFTVAAPVNYSAKPAANVNADAGTGCSAAVNYNFVIAGTAPITTTYTFSGATTGSGSGTGSGSIFNVGSTQVSVSSSNTCSPPAVYTFNIIVTDHTAPTAIVQDLTVALDASGNAIITAAQVDNGSSDNCGTPTLAISRSNFSCADIDGAASTELFISEYVEGSGNNKAIELFNGTPASIDLSGYQIRIYANGATSPNSTTALTGTITAGGSFVIAHSSAAASTLAVADQTNGNINFNGNDAVVLTKTNGTIVDLFGKIGNDPGSAWISGSNSTMDATLRRRSYVHSGVVANPSGTGSGAFVTLSTEWEAFAVDNISNLGNHILNNQIPVTLTVTDNNYNSATATALVTVVDATAPVVPTLATVSGECSATVSAPVATDNCAGTITGTTSDPTSFNTQGTYSIVWSFDDGNGNISTATQVVVVDDVTAPAAPTLSTVTGECSATVSAPVATDNCAGTITGTTNGPTSFNTQGTHTIEWSFDDGNGNISYANQTVVVNDNTPPTLGSLPNIVLSACETTATWTAPSANDNCPGFIVEQIAGPASGAAFANGTTTTITYRVTDVNGNTATSSFTVSRKVALLAMCSTNNSSIYFGYSGDQTAIVSVNVAGGTGPYTIVASMNRALRCNQVNASGDELWTAVGASSVNNICPGTGSATLAPTSTFSGVGAGTYSVNVTLMANASITFTITDANGCTSTCTQIINAEDVRCFAGNSGNAKIAICHQTGSDKNHCKQICVDESALSAHLAHGDYVGNCTPGCEAPNNLIAGNLNTGLELELQVVPNPTPDFFNIYVKSSNNEPVIIRVMDMFGRTVMNNKVAPNSRLKFGHNIAAGTYFVQALQGDRKMLRKVIKVN